MLKVQCTGCQSAYEIEERRVPAGGLKMRCTKCGTSLRVDHSAASASSDTDAMLPSLREGRRPGAQTTSGPAIQRMETAPSLDLDWGEPELPSSLGRASGSPVSLGRGPASGGPAPLGAGGLASGAAAPLGRLASGGKPTAESDIDLQDLPAVLRGPISKSPDDPSSRRNARAEAARPTVPELKLDALALDSDLPEVFGRPTDRKAPDASPAKSAPLRRDVATARSREAPTLELPSPAPREASLPAVRPPTESVDLPVKSAPAGFGELDLPLLAAEPPVLSAPDPTALDPALPSLRGLKKASPGLPPRPGALLAGLASGPASGAPIPVAPPSGPTSTPPLASAISDPPLAAPISVAPFDTPIGKPSAPLAKPSAPLEPRPDRASASNRPDEDWLSLPLDPELQGRAAKIEAAGGAGAGLVDAKRSRSAQSGPPKAFGEIELTSSEPIALDEIDFGDPSAGPFEKGVQPLSPEQSPRSKPLVGGRPIQDAKTRSSRPAQGEVVDLTDEVSFASAPPGAASAPPGAASAPPGAASAPPATTPMSRALPPAGDAGDDMEFGAIPQEMGDKAFAPDAAAGLGRASQAPASKPQPDEKARASRSRLWIVGGLALVLVAGGALEVVSPFGAFGRHVLSDLINADRYRALQASTLDTAKRLLAADVYSDAMRAVSVSELAYAQAPRVHGLLAYGAFLGYMTELRFGRSASTEAHAQQELATLSEDKSSLFLDLARVAQAAVGSHIPRARQLIDTLEQRYPRDPDVTLLSAEIALVAKEPEKAMAEFQKAEQILGPSARTAYGNARAFWAAGDEARALVAARSAVERSPNHAAARVLAARALWSKGDEAGAMSALTQVTGPFAVREAASSMELVDALTVTSRIHMARSRMSQAESVLSEALRIDPKSGAALAGMGEVLYREGRFTESLAKFEAGIQADPEGVQAKIGSAKAKIALERMQEAKDQLKKLRDARQNDAEVSYWLGRTEEALGDRDSASKSYQEAMLVGGAKAEVVDAYIALARLLVSEGRNADADAILAEARRKLPASPSVHRGLGSVHLQAGRFDAARVEFESALKQDPDDLAARFELATTLRRMGKFEQATAELDRLSTSDPQYPGLALERGLLLEASNHVREALDFYQQALSKAPDDPDLMLRVGSAEVGSGHAGQAEEILRKVVLKRPNSAEVNHYLGRALLLKGTNLAEALRYLKRAVEIDPNRADYHLYVGWAANEAGQPAVAREELDKALELDKGLADAYWQKGELLRKQAAIVDAMRYAEKALELRPTRYEAYATMAQCYQDQNRNGDAIAAWRKAISADENVPEWHYRLGKLLNRGGEAELDKAVKLAELVDTKPGWLAQAHFELAEIEQGTGKRSEAIEHFRRFLSIAKTDSPYRADAKRALGTLGAPYED